MHKKSSNPQHQKLFTQVFVITRTQQMQHVQLWFCSFWKKHIKQLWNNQQAPGRNQTDKLEYIYNSLRKTTMYTTCNSIYPLKPNCNLYDTLKLLLNLNKQCCDGQKTQVTGAIQYEVMLIKHLWNNGSKTNSGKWNTSNTHHNKPTWKSYAHNC